MRYFVRRPWDLAQKLHTSEEIYANRQSHRREFLKMMGIGAAGIGLGTNLLGCSSATDEDVLTSGKVDVPTALSERSAEAEKEANEEMPLAENNAFGARKNLKFEYGRPETKEEDAARYTNFYEFSGSKDNFWRVGDFEPHPWKFEITGLCAKPRVFDIDDIYKMMKFEERDYRHRCVETWAMCVPWTGFVFSELLKLVEPSPKAKFVGFQTFDVPNEKDEKAGISTFKGPNMSSAFSSYPWPYTEGLTMEEAMNELTFIATGIYGKPLAKQHGAPIRLVLPWKYGFKSCKSITRITLTDKQPATFWNTINPHEYGFTANVNPEVPHPRWSQATEWMLPSRDVRYDTVIYNGYGDYVAKLYPS